MKSFNLKLRQSSIVFVMLACFACSNENVNPGNQAASSQLNISNPQTIHADCSSPIVQPLISSIQILDSDGNPFDLVNQRFQSGANYYVSVSGNSPGFCITITLGGTLTNPANACLTNVPPANFEVTSNGGIAINGTITPEDPCGGSLPQYAVTFHFKSNPLG